MIARQPAPVLPVSAFSVGDMVRPRSEWRADPNNVPSGPIVQIEPWGGEGAIHIAGERRAFAGYVFEQVEPCGPTSGTVIRPR